VGFVLAGGAKLLEQGRNFLDAKHVVGGRVDRKLQVLG
jgi:hypothetical protein